MEVIRKWEGSRKGGHRKEVGRKFEGSSWKEGNRKEVRRKWEGRRKDIGRK